MAGNISGLEPLAYMGVEAKRPPTLVRKAFAPSASNTEFAIGTIWINTSTGSIYFLTNLDSGVATWTALEGSSITIMADSGSATEIDNAITLSGGNIVTTSGSGAIVTIALTQGSDGQIPIGATSSDPAWANLTSTGGSVTITNTANGINLEAAGVAALTQLDGDSGSATPLAGVITVAGGTNITTSGAVNTLTVDLDNSISLAGTLTLAASTEGVLVADGSGVVSSSAANDGQLLIGSTGASPVIGDLASADGSIEFTAGAGTLDLKVTGQLTLNAQTGTTYALVLADANKLVTLSNASAIALTVPLNSSVAFPVGAQILLEAAGVGTVTVAGDVGVTVNSRGSVYSSAGQYAMMSLIKLATDVWVLSGDLA